MNANPRAIDVAQAHILQDLNNKTVHNRLNAEAGNTQVSVTMGSELFGLNAKSLFNTLSANYTKGQGVGMAMQALNLNHEVRQDINRMERYIPNSTMLSELNPRMAGMNEAIREMHRGLGTLQQNGGFAPLVLENEQVGGRAQERQSGGVANLSLGRVGATHTSGAGLGVGGNITYHFNDNISAGVGLVGGKSLFPSAFATFTGGAENDTSRRGLNTQIGLRFPLGVVLDINIKFDGRSLTLPLGTLLNPATALMGAFQLGQSAVKAIFGERDGAAYETVAHDTRPMKAPYKELTVGTPPDLQLNELGKNVVEQLRADLINNPSAKFYMGGQDRKAERSLAEQKLLMQAVQAGLPPEAQARIVVGQPPATDKEIISANYANVLIVNENNAFFTKGFAFYGLTSPQAKGAEKEIAASAEWKDLVQQYDLDKKERAMLMKVVLTTSNAINEGSLTPAQVLKTMAQSVYAKGFTLDEMAREQNPQIHIARIRDSEAFKQFADDNNLSRKDKQNFAEYVFNRSLEADGPKTLPELLADAKSNLLDRNLTLASLDKFMKEADSYFKTLKQSPSSQEKLVGEMYDLSNDAEKLILKNHLFNSFVKVNNGEVSLPRGDNIAAMLKLDDASLSGLSQIATLATAAQGALKVTDAARTLPTYQQMIEMGKDGITPTEFNSINSAVMRWSGLSKEQLKAETGVEDVRQIVQVIGQYKDNLMAAKEQERQYAATGPEATPATTAPAPISLEAIAAAVQPQQQSATQPTLPVADKATPSQTMDMAG